MITGYDDQYETIVKATNGTVLVEFEARFSNNQGFLEDYNPTQARALAAALIKAADEIEGAGE